jgi:hypothetical protein
VYTALAAYNILTFVSSSKQLLLSSILSLLLLLPL